MATSATPQSILSSFLYLSTKTIAGPTLAHVVWNGEDNDVRGPPLKIVDALHQTQARTNSECLGFLYLRTLRLLMTMRNN